MHLAKHPIIKFAQWASVVLILIASSIIGCGPRVAPSFEQAATQVSAIRTDIGTQNNSIAQNAHAIQATAVTLKVAAPTTQFATGLDQIIHFAGNILDASGVITAIQMRIETLSNEIDQGRADNQLLQSKLTAEQKARAADKLEYQRKLDAANSALAKKLQMIQVFAMLAMGLAVGIGVWSRDIHIALAGAAASIAVFISCMVLGEVNKHVILFTAMAVGAAVIWIAIEIYARGSVTQTIKPSTRAATGSGASTGA